MRVQQFVLGACFAVFTLPAFAAEPGFYFGLSGGRAEYDIDRAQAPVVLSSTFPTTPVATPSPSLPRGALTTPIAGFFAGTTYNAYAIAIPGGISLYSPGADDHDSSWSVLAGYQANRYAAVELSYVDLGKISGAQTFYLSPLSPLTPFNMVQLRESLDTYGGSFSILGMLPLTSQWDVYLRGGMFYMDTQFNTGIASARHSQSENSRGTVVGLGTQITFGSHWTVRAEAQRYSNVGDDLPVQEFDVDTLTLSVLFRL